MDRRTLLKLLAATTLHGVAPGRSQERGLKVVVAGAGIVGASIAYHLAKEGSRVSVIDREGPATNASRGTFAWINATYAKQPRHYHHLSQLSVAHWHELHRELNLPLRWGGSLEWFDEPERQDALVSQIAEQASWGEPARMLDAQESRQLEPNIEFSDAQQTALSGNDGTVDPEIATRALLAAAQAMGATTSFPCELTGLAMTGGRLAAVQTSSGSIPADRLVLATGSAPTASRRFAGLDVPQRTTPGVIAITRPTKRLLNRVISAPGIHMHQRDDGRIVLGEQAGVPDNDRHSLRLEGRPRRFPNRQLALEHAGRMQAIARQFLPAIASLAVEDVHIGWRPLPIDGHPVLGVAPERPDVYLAIMHSGVTLAPIVGQLAARELVRGEAIATLADFRPGRVFRDTRRY